MANTFLNAPLVRPPVANPSSASCNVGTTFVVHEKIVTGDSNTVTLFSKNFPCKARLIDAHVVMYGDGASGDTWKVQHGDGASSESFTDVTDTVTVSAAGDRDIVRAGELSDAAWEINRNASVKLITASGALVDLYLTYVPVKE